MLIYRGSDDERADAPRAPIGDVRAVLSRVALMAAALLFSLLVGEGVLRALPEPCEPSLFPWIVFDPILGWRNVLPDEAARCEFNERERERSESINAGGFRGPLVVRRKPEGTLRIVCLGDSATFGVRGGDRTPGPDVPFWDLSFGYVGELRRILDTKGYSHIEVINAGTIGYTSSHGLRLLNARMLDFDPDIVTIRFGANDPTPAWDAARRATEPRNAFVRRLLYRFDEWKLLRAALRAYQKEKRFHPEEKTVVWVDPEQFRANLARFVELSRERDFHLLALDYPMGELRGGSPVEAALRTGQDAYGRIQREFATKAGMELLSTAPALVPLDEYFTESDRVHPSDAGARKIAELLFARLDTLGWLRSP